MNPESSSNTPDEVNTSNYLSSAQIAEELGVSISTVARYRSEYAAYLRSYCPVGGGRGLRREAFEILKLIHKMKSERAHWTEIKQALDARSEEAVVSPELAGTVSLRRSLEAIHRSQQVLSNELRYFLQNASQRIEKLEKEYLRLSATLQKHVQSSQKKPAEKPDKSAEAQEQNESWMEAKRAHYPQAESLFPEESTTESSDR